MASTGILIRRATTDAERAAIVDSRLRVDALERPARHEQTDANPAIVTDPLDESASLYGAWEGERIVGSVRANRLTDAGLDDYRTAYAIGNDLRPDRVTITTRLAVLPEYRHSGLIFDLIRTTYERALDLGIEHDFTDCRPQLAALFERLGYRRHRTGLMHRDYGAIVVMRLALFDADHLKAVWSPLAPVLHSRRRRRAALAI